MIAEHESIEVNQFNGLFDKGSDESVPLGYFVDTLNTAFDTRGVFTRDGSVRDLTIAKTILRCRTFEKTGEAIRYLYLTSGGSIFDSTAPGTAILTVSGMTDFALQVMFDRAYISPHNGDRGLPGEFIYVYDGTGVARISGGSGPTTAPTVSTSTTAGYIEKGKHLFAIAYETSSGFITQRGPAVVYDAPGSFQANMGSISIGPTGTVARWILATKAIQNYNGDTQGYEYFFVPNGRIANNASTTATVNFFDADLTASADFLYDQLARTPAGVYLGIYKGALISCGENDNPARLRVSKFNEPESFDAVVGFIDIYPKDNGGPVRNAIEFRNQLIIHKSYRSYITQEIGDNPAFWNVGALDKSVGSECNGLCRVLDVDGTSNDNFLVASRSGLLAFDGSYSQNLTLNIHDIWMRINKLYFHKILVAFNPIQGGLYVAVPLDTATECSHILFCDFSADFTADSAKWSIWKMKDGISITGLFVDVLFSSRIATMKFVGYDGNIYVMDENATDDDGVAIDSYVKFPFLAPEAYGAICLFSGVRMLISGSGVLQINVQGLDGNLNIDTPSITLVDHPGIEKTRQFILENERCSVKIRVSNFGEWFNLRHFRLFSTPIWAERPDE